MNMLNPVLANFNGRIAWTGRARSLLGRSGAAAAALALLLTMAGCATTTDTAPVTAPSPTAKPDAILEGDTLKIDFIGAPSLNTTQEVRRDGRISLPVAGEVVAAGLTPTELAKVLSKRYANELLSNDVLVTIVSSAFSVNVSGAVLHPGKITSKGPITALQAVMEAGGFDAAKANMRHVTVVRSEQGKVRNYVLDLQSVLDGKSTEAFYLKPWDVVYVPTRFVWF